MHSTFAQSRKFEKWLDKADKYLQLQARVFLTSFLKFSNFLKITPVARTKNGNVGSGSKCSHAVPRITRCTAISTDGVSGYWISFRHSTGFPYRRVSTDSIFQCAINDSRPQCWALERPFSAPNDTDNNGPEHCRPNVPMRWADNSLKWSNSLQYTGNHNCK